MSILKGKHTIKEIDGTRCTVVEKGATAERVRFLTNLLTSCIKDILVRATLNLHPAQMLLNTWYRIPGQLKYFKIRGTGFMVNSNTSKYIVQEPH